MRKLFTLFFALVASVGTMFAASGKCGDNLTWDLSGYGVLTITGTGDMTDFDWNNRAPWYSYRSLIIEVSVGNSVTSIGKYAFSDCTGLTSVSIGNSVTSIGHYAFQDCTGLTSVTIGNSVTSIGHYAFGNCSGLTSITIPNSVTSIDAYAFLGCAGLTSPIYNSHVFAYMPTSYSGSYSIPDGIESIAGGAFRDCTGLTSITIPNSVTSIGGGAFYECTGLTSITIPNSVTSIGGSAFFYCRGLRSVTIPNSITSIGKDVFYKCTGLISVTIPNSVTSIGDEAFYDCTGLTSVSIGNSVTSIGDKAFLWCSNLSTITCYATTPPSLGSSVFSSVPTSCVIYVPKKSVSAYQNADGWKDFTISSDPITVRLDPTSCSSWQTVYLWAWTSSGDLFDEWPGIVVSKDASGWYSYTFDESVEKVNIIWTDGTNQTIDITDVEESTCYSLNSTSGKKITVSTVDCPLPPTTYTVTITSMNTSMGTVSGGGRYKEGESVTVTATPKSGYKFKEWKEGNTVVSTQSTYTFTVTKDVILIAYFEEAPYYTITVSSYDESMGTVSGGGTYKEGESVTVTATPKSGYKFSDWFVWQDGVGQTISTENPFTFVAREDIEIIANFEEDSPTMLTCAEAVEIAKDLTHNTPTSERYTVVGYVTNTDGKISNGQQIFWMADTKGGGKVFESYWGNVSEVMQVDDKVSVTGNLMRYYSTYEIKNGDVELLSREEPTMYTVTVSSYDKSMGTVSGGGQYEEGSTATITATPKSGYKFTQWSNGSTANPYSFTVTQNISLTAYFEQSSTPQQESKFWNISDDAFNSLGILTSNKTINGLTIYATSSKNVVIDESIQEIDGLSFTHRLKFGGTGASDARCLSFHVDGDCYIDVYLKSASGSADRTLNVDKGSFGNSWKTIPALGASISKGTVHYTGNATTIYLYSPSSGVNIYAIRLSYGNSQDIKNPTTGKGYKAQKILYNGQIFILRGDKTYTITGQEVR